MMAAAPYVAPLIAFFVCLVATLLLERWAELLGLLDRPGGRKTHSAAVPLVGGLGVFSALLITAWLTGMATSAGYFLFALSLVVAVGLWDDRADIAPGAKLAAQIVGAGTMIWGAGVQLVSVGDLLGWRPIGLWMLSAPVTIFAVVGVINAFNMVDGMDGLGGCIALIAFAWYAAVAAQSGLLAQFNIAIVICGCLAGFLLLNLRLPWQPRARVFLGDAGSLALGFALAWLAIDLTQGRGRTFPPIAALWVVVLPLADCVSLIARRLRAGRSPFIADSRHVHHYLRARGLTHNQVLMILITLSIGFGAVGFVGWQLAVPEPALFWPFFFGFFAYHRWIDAAWKRLDASRPEVVPGGAEMSSSAS